MIFIPGPRHDDILIFHNGIHIYRAAFAFPDPAGDHNAAAVLEFRAAGRGAGGKDKELIVRVHIHIAVGVEGAGADVRYKIHKGFIAGKIGAQIIKIRAVLGPGVQQHHRENLILRLLVQRVQRD